MGAEMTGKVLVAAKFENIEDIGLRERGMLPPDQVRTTEVTDALVDTGAWGLLLPKRYILQLGLRHVFSRHARGIGGKVSVPMYSPVKLTIQGRDCSMDVGEVADDMPILIGQLPLEALDWVVDLKNQRLIGNPEHGGEWIMDIY
jgi:predicted aspartyl protease